jgi:hypothetical protein
VGHVVVPATPEDVIAFNAVDAIIASLAACSLRCGVAYAFSQSLCLVTQQPLEQVWQ